MVNQLPSCLPIKIWIALSLHTSPLLPLVLPNVLKAKREPLAIPVWKDILDQTVCLAHVNLELAVQQMVAALANLDGLELPAIHAHLPDVSSMKLTTSCTISPLLPTQTLITPTSAFKNITSISWPTQIMHVVDSIPQFA